MNWWERLYIVGVFLLSCFFPKRKFSIHFLFCKKVIRAWIAALGYIIYLFICNTRIIALQSQKVCSQPIDLVSIQMAVSVCVRLSVFCAISYTFCVIWWVVIFLFGTIHQPNQQLHRQYSDACFSSYIFKQVPIIVFKTQIFNEFRKLVVFSILFEKKNRSEQRRKINSQMDW